MSLKIWKTPSVTKQKEFCKGEQHFYTELYVIRRASSEFWFRQKVVPLIHYMTVVLLVCVTQPSVNCEKWKTSLHKKTIQICILNMIWLTPIFVFFVFPMSMHLYEELYLKVGELGVIQIRVDVQRGAHHQERFELM